MPIAAAVALLVSLLAPATGTAATATFGANLSRPADNPLTCLQTQLIPTFPTCTVTSINLATGESAFPPAGEGIVSAVRVRVGPATGPMQIVVERALRQDNPFEPGKPNFACCSVLAMSPVFTPAANAVTQIPVDFRVRQDTTPDQNGIYVSDHLALSVLQAGVPIPAAVDNQASVQSWYPAWQAVGEQRTGQAGGFGLNVLINADWDPVGAAGAPAIPAAPGAVRAVSIPNRQALVRNARARVLLRCALDIVCSGRLLLQNRNRGAAASALIAGASRAPARGGKAKQRTRRTLTYGSVKFRIKPGGRAAVRVKLNHRGKALMRKKARPKVWANLKMRGHAPPSKRITLRPAPRR